MDHQQAYDYLARVGGALKASDPENSYKTGLHQFVDKKSYRPFYEPFKLGTLLTDQRENDGGKE
jgi:trans-feruloyl-CoA hydratase/vanillin synthase